jgi:hypothetical protein
MCEELCEALCGKMMLKCWKQGKMEAFISTEAVDIGGAAPSTMGRCWCCERYPRHGRLCRV